MTGIFLFLKIDVNLTFNIPLYTILFFTITLIVLPNFYNRQNKISENVKQNVQKKWKATYSKQVAFFNASNANGDLQKSFKDACNEEMAIAILGNTETTSASKSSGYAQSKEHAEQQDEIIAADLVMIEPMVVRAI